MSRTMLLALPVILQALGANAAGFADVLLRDIVLPRSPAGALVGDAFGVFEGTPTVEARALPSACSFVLGAIEYCSSVSPGWIDAPAKTQATCLCYSSASWAPSIFDNSVSSCAQYARTADPTDYSVISALGGFCSSAGNVRGNTVATSVKATSSFATTSANPSVRTSSPTITPGPTTAKPTGSSTALSAAPGCSTISRLLNSCSSATRGFTDLPPASQAACLCYTSSSYAPGNFDDNISTCAGWASTALPTAYPVFSALQDFCDDEGDVRGGASATRSTRQTSAALTGVGISALAGPQTDSGPTTAAPTANPTANNNAPVTVTGGSSIPTVKSAAGLELTAWNNMVLGIGSVAVSVILFL